MKKLDDAKNTNKSLTWSENDQIYWFNFSLTEEIGRVRARFTYPHKIQDAEGIEKESETLERVRTQPSDVMWRHLTPDWRGKAHTKWFTVGYSDECFCLCLRY